MKFINKKNNQSDILKTKGKLKIMSDNIIDNNVMHNMITRNMNSMQ